MDPYYLLKMAHILGAGVLFGTGAGIAFFMLQAYRQKDLAAFAAVAHHVVVADYIFTASAAVFQPITGALLIWRQGYDFSENWIILSLILYGVIGLCWLPVVAIQIRVRKIARAALERGETSYPADLRRNMRLWFWLGWPAFISIIVIYWLMITKPDFA